MWRGISSRAHEHPPLINSALAIVKVAAAFVEVAAVFDANVLALPPDVMWVRR
jgi:hypothetical protein